MAKKQIKMKTIDALWSKLVKLQAGNKCEACGKLTYLNSHHIYSRSKHITRWNLDNGVCLCAGCHTLSSTFSAHKTPLEFVEWLMKTRGEEFIAQLRLLSNSIIKVDREAVYNDLKEIGKQYV